MSTIEIGGASAADPQQEHDQRVGTRKAVQKQRRERRVKDPVREVHQVDRSMKPPSRRAASRLHNQEEGPARRWRRAHSLPSFPDPPGFRYTWIARHRRRHGDNAGLLASIREGWQFVRPDELPDEDLPTETFEGRLSKYGEVIGDETTILMKMPLELIRQRDAHYNGKRDATTRAVTKRNPGLEGVNNKMPLVEDRNEHATDFPQMRARRPERREQAET